MIWYTDNLYFQDTDTEEKHGKNNEDNQNKF